MSVINANPGASEAAAEKDSFHPPDLLPPPLPQGDALRLANLANVPPDQHEQFFDSVHWAMALAWMRDIRALGRPAGKALVRAAEAARTLHMELGKLDQRDRKWIERSLRRTREYNVWLRDLSETTFRLAHLLSTSVGLSPPRPAAIAPQPGQKSNRARTRKDVFFVDFVVRLRSVVRDFGGNLTLDHEHKKGTLLDALRLLRPYLPEGVVPKEPPVGTLKKIVKSDYILDAPMAEIDFFSPE